MSKGTRLRVLVSTFLLAILLPVPLSHGATDAPSNQDEANALGLSESLFQEVSDSPAESDLLQGEAAISLLAQMQGQQFDEVPEHGVYDRGFTTAELIRDVGIIAIVLAIGILITLQFVDVSANSYRWSLLIALFILPFFVTLSATTTTLEETKTVTSCQSCHVMDPFINDMLNEESNTLAARHYNHRWIPKHQCYECHTSYGVHGTIEGKRDGFRHWLLYVTRTWPDPITYAGSYPNANCTACHGGSPAYESVESHQSLSAEIQADEVTCTTCHGPPHPLPGERYPDGNSHGELAVSHEDLTVIRNGVD